MTRAVKHVELRAHALHEPDNVYCDRVSLTPATYIFTCGNMVSVTFIFHHPTVDLKQNGFIAFFTINRTTVPVEVATCVAASTLFVSKCTTQNTS